ncbi:MAG TPA: IPTL-CTERM sorting domain-containing protein [Candidatus Competibacteraceae bacterium]|nr:IPTL-CTERM sorting domain-containing protein [Candidatus Competibacteraceae bacterium]
MKTPHSFTPHRLAAAVVLALSGPSALAADFYVGANSDPGDSDPASLDCSNASNTTCTLSAAIYAANQASGSDTIFLTTDVTLTGIMLRLIDSDMTLDGQGHTIDGGGFRPLFVKSGTVTIKNMVISNGLAQGGAGYYSYNGHDYGGGGGGAGLGGALFIYSGTVTVSDTTFNANKAQGGLSNPVHDGGAGGGGMFGNSAFGGGGLFGNGSSLTGGYGGTGSYNSTNSTFGAGGNGSDTNNNAATAGGFGGGGGGGGGSGYSDCYNSGSSGSGGFGGGGGSSCNYDIGGSNGGFGGGGGGASYPSFHTGVGGYGGGGGSAGSAGDGGSGAGFGGAIFVMRGELTLHNVNFSGNDATGGSGQNPGQGRGGAVFICTANLTDSGTNQAPTQCGGSINETSCGVITANDTASDGQPELFWKNANDTYLDFSAIDATKPCPVTPTGPTSPIPTLSEWGLLMMSSLLGLFGAWRTRKVAGSRTKRRT